MKKILLPLSLTTASLTTFVFAVSSTTTSNNGKTTIYTYDENLFNPNDPNNKFVGMDNFYALEDNYKSGEEKQVEILSEVQAGEYYPVLKSRVKVNMLNRHDDSVISNKEAGSFWNAEKQKWSIEFNRGPVVPWKNGDENLWASNPRIGFIISNDLKVVPGTIKVKVYSANPNATNSERSVGDPSTLISSSNSSDRTIFDPYGHSNVKWKLEKTLEITNGSNSSDIWSTDRNTRTIEKNYDNYWSINEALGLYERSVLRNISYFKPLTDKNTYDNKERPERFNEYFKSNMLTMGKEDINLWKESDSNYNEWGRYIENYVGAGLFIKTDTPRDRRNTKYIIEFETTQNYGSNFIDKPGKSYVAGVYTAGGTWEDFWNSLRSYRAIDVRTAKRQQVHNVTLSINEIDPLSSLTNEDFTKYKEVLEAYEITKRRLPLVRYQFTNTSDTLIKKIDPDRANALKFGTSHLTDAKANEWNQKGRFTFPIQHSNYNSVFYDNGHDLKVEWNSSDDQKIWDAKIEKITHTNQQNNGYPEYKITFSLKKDWLETELQNLKNQEAENRKRQLKRLRFYKSRLDELMNELVFADYIPEKRRESYFERYTNIYSELNIDTFANNKELLSNLAHLIHIVNRYSNIYRFNYEYGNIENRFNSVKSVIDSFNKLINESSNYELEKKIELYNKIYKSSLVESLEAISSDITKMMTNKDEMNGLKSFKTMYDEVKDYNSKTTFKDPDDEAGLYNLNIFDEKKDNNKYIKVSEDMIYNNPQSGKTEFHPYENINNLLNDMKIKIVSMIPDYQKNGSFYKKLEELEKTIKSDLTKRKNDILSKINQLNNLSNGYKDDLKSKIEALVSENTVESLSKMQSLYNTENNINTMIGDLRDKILPETNMVVNQNKYKFAELSNVNAFNTSRSNAESILEIENSKKVLKRGISNEKVYEYIETLKHNIQELDGDQQLAKIKEELKKHLDTNKSYLSPQQIALFNNKINDVENNKSSLYSLTSEARNIKNSITSTNNKMNEIKTKLTELKSKTLTNNYKFSDDNTKTKYDLQLSDTEKGFNSLNKELSNSLSSPYEFSNWPKDSVLNGDAYINSKKSEIDSLTNLSKNQRNLINNQLSNLNDRNEVDTLTNNLKTLNTKLTELNTLVSEETKVKSSVDYISEPEQTKKTAYDNAINEAKEILKSLGTNNNLANSTEVTTQTAKIIDSINKINNAKKALTGAALAKAREDFENWINSKGSYTSLKHYLNDAQKKDFLDKNKKAQSVEAINKLKTDAQALDEVMKRLHDKTVELANENTKSNYINSEESIKKNFNSALQTAKDLVAKTGTLKDKQNVETVLNALTSAHNALNGDARLKAEKARINSEIDLLTHLNNKQKQSLKNEINSKTLINDLPAIKTQATELDKSMDTLSALVSAGNLLKNNQQNPWKYGDQTLKNNVDQLLGKANNVINKVSGENKNKTEVDELSTSLRNAIKSLRDKYTKDLDEAKQRAKDELTKSTLLPEKVKKEFLSKIENEPSIDSLNELTQNIHDLNEAVSALKTQINKANEVKKTDVYGVAVEPNKSNFDQALTNAETVINNLSSNSEKISEVKEATNNLISAMNRLDSANAELNAKKDEAKAAIDRLSNLNNNQKTQLKSDVENATTKEQVDDVLAKANNLDQKMAELKKLVEKVNAELSKTNYIESTNKNALDEALEKAKNILNNSINDFNNQNSDAVSKITDELKKQLDALDGEQVLNNLKQSLLSKIDNDYSSLNDQQKNKAIKEVTEATTKEQLKDLETKYTNLNNDMKLLNSALDKANKAKETSNYANSKDNIKNELDKLIKEAEKVVDKNTNNNYPEKQKTNSEIQKLTNDLNGKIGELNGDQLLREEKEKALQNLNTVLTNLNNSQKEAIKNEIESAPSIEELNKVIKKASELNDVMKNANKVAFDDINTFKQTPDYNSKSKDKKDKFDAVVAEVQNSLTNNNLSKEQVEELLNKLQTAKDEFNENDDLDQLRNKFIAELDTDKYNSLINSQKEELKKLAQAASNIDQLNNLINNQAIPLNDYMKQLKELIEQSNSTKLTADYLEATPELRNKFDQTLSESHRISQDNFAPLNNEDQYIYNPEKVHELVEKLRNDLNGLDGLDKYQNSAIEEIDSLEHINNSQKNYLINEVRLKDNKEDIVNIIEKAKELDNSMAKLIDAVENANSQKNTDNYTNASIPNKKHFDSTLSVASDLISKESANNADKSEVDRLINELQTALDGLNGSNNLKNKLSELKKYIDEKDKIVVTERFTKSPQEAQDKYLELIDKAKDLINDPEVTVEKVNDLIEQIERAKNNLVDPKGHYTVADKNFIDDLQNINRNEKNFFKEQIEIAPDGETVELIKNEAVKLDNKKAEAKDIIENLNNLSNSEKEHFKNLVDQHTSVLSIPLTEAQLKEIDEIILQAQKQDLINKIKNNPLLNDKEKEYYLDKVESVKNKDEFEKVKQLVDSVINKKQTAVDEINNLPNLNQSEKDKFIEKIKNTDLLADQNNNINSAEIDKIVEKAKEINNKKQEVIDLINSKENL
ncbi:GA module-containing protein, partial [Mycoplasmopsis anatis]|uniref:GA module-containing protein n=1 Tax=Mycoplasmopsis anatis TaxID=171279 RepID=UPI001C4ECC10